MIIYLPMALDYIHIGHINILKQAIKLRQLEGYGMIMIGLVSDERIDEYKERHHTYTQRYELAHMLRGVDMIVKEYEKPLFIGTIKRFQPQYVIHGDDWAKPSAALFDIRNQIKEVLDQYGGQLIEPPYTQGINSTCIRKKLVQSNQ